MYYRMIIEYHDKGWRVASNSMLQINKDLTFRDLAYFCFDAMARGYRVTLNEDNPSIGEKVDAVLQPLESYTNRYKR